MNGAPGLLGKHRTASLSKEADVFFLVHIGPRHPMTTLCSSSRHFPCPEYYLAQRRGARDTGRANQ